MDRPFSGDLKLRCCRKDQKCFRVNINHVLLESGPGVITIVQVELLKFCWLSFSRFAPKDPKLKVSAVSLAGVGIVEEE